MSETCSKENLVKIGEYIATNYPADEKYRAEDEEQQRLDVAEDTRSQFGMGNAGGMTMSMAVSLPATQREFVTINQMAGILGIGHNSIRQLVRENPTADYIFMRGTRTYLKREMFIDIMKRQSAI